MKFIGLIMILALFIYLIVNSGMVIYRLIKTVCAGLNPIVFGIVFGTVILSILALFVLSRIPDNHIPRFLLQFSHHGLGVFVYFTVFVNLTALLIYIGKLTKLIKIPQYNLVSLSAYALCVVVIVSLSTYGIVNAKSIKTVKYSIDIQSDMTSGMKIALVSDIHLGYIIDETHLQKVVDAVNKIEPDVVCIAGDIFDGDMTSLSNPDAIKKVFRSIKSKYGVYACFGNHDAGKSYKQMHTFLSDTGIKLLQDEYVIIDNRLILVGRRDSSPIGGHDGDRKEIELPQDNTFPVVVLDHQPGNIDEYNKNVDLILCGHTHLGQMFPFGFIVKGIFDAGYGYYRKTDTSPQVITTSGVGTWGPTMRIGSNNEVVEIILR